MIIACLKQRATGSARDASYVKDTAFCLVLGTEPVTPDLHFYCRSWLAGSQVSFH